MMINTTRIGMPRGSPRQGFTLIKLLVSITIIIVLAAMVFVVTGKIRTNAQQTNALSSLRQIGIANLAYYTGNNGAINVIRDAGEWGSFEGPGTAYASNSFIGRMQPYLFAGIGTTNEKVLAAEIKSSLSALFNTSGLASMAGTLFNGVPVTTDGSGIRNPIAINANLRPQWGKTNAPLRLSSFGDPSGGLYLTMAAIILIRFNAAPTRRCNVGRRVAGSEPSITYRIAKPSSASLMTMSKCSPRPSRSVSSNTWGAWPASVAVPQMPGKSCCQNA